MRKQARAEEISDISEASQPDERSADEVIAGEPEEPSQGTKRLRRPVAAAVVVVGAVVAAFLIARPDSGHPIAAAKPVAPAATPASSPAELAADPTTPPPAPEKITSCSRWDPTLEAGYQTWHTAMNAPDATFAARASATSLLASQASDTSTADTAVTGDPLVPDALDSTLLERALVPLEDDLPLNQATGTLPASYSADVQGVVAVGALFSAC